MIIYQPYTYLIGWSTHNKYYYGVRTAKKCNPNDLWVTYFTSSKYVKEFRKLYGEPDIIKIRKVFLDSKKALLWEEKIIKRLCLKSEKWLNRGNGGKDFSTTGIIPWNKGKQHSLETRKKLSDWQKEIKRSKEHVKNMSLSRKGKQKTEEHKMKISKAHKGKKVKNPEKCASFGFLGKKLSPESILKRTESRRRNKLLRQELLTIDSSANI